MHLSFSDAEPSWDLTWDDTRMRLRIAGGQLMCDFFGPLGRPIAADDRWPLGDSIFESREEQLLQIGPHLGAPRWAAQNWQQPDADSFELTLTTNDAPLAIDLRLSADTATGIVHRSTRVRHTGAGEAVEVRHAVSAAALLPNDIYEVVQLSGRWGAETQQVRSPMLNTTLRVESRAGKTGFEHSPYVALLAPEHTYLIELLWSGNWQIDARRLSDDRVSLWGGLNDWGLRHTLLPGATFDLPDALLLCVRGDLNAATQRLHDYRRRRRPDPDRPVPIHFNSWYPYQGEPPVAKMKEFAEAAARLGCETFVLDAGWYTTEQEDPAENWWTRTGDWVVNRRLFPNGLEELADFCRERNLGFGIWFEPEAVSPSAVVRSAHPEWLQHPGGRAPEASARAILNLGVPEARAFARERILKILRATGATWMKWDFNTNLNQGGWAPGLPETLTAEDPLIAHYRGLYTLQDELRAAVPALTLEMCAGGGGRFDGAILSHGHTNWMSDQPAALVNLAIHFGSHLAHAPVECNDWLIEWPPHDGLLRKVPIVDERGDLAFRLRIAMLGTFGISAPVDRWSAAEFAIAQTHVAWYRDHIRPLVQRGDQYLLTEAPPVDGNGDWAAIWYAAKDRSGGALFAFRLAGAAATRQFALPGLDPAARYRLRTPEGWNSAATGAELAAGLAIDIGEPFGSALIVVEQV